MNTAKSRTPANQLNIGIINLMPNGECYREELISAMDKSGPVRFHLIRLLDHAYKSTDSRELASYKTFAQVISETRLDGLVLTGAPVEGIPFHEVSYWEELKELIQAAKQQVPNILGLCWGGMVLIKMLNIEKRVFKSKRFGVFPLNNLEPKHPLMANLHQPSWCPLSSHAGYDDAELEAARDAGILKLLAHHPETGYLVLETNDSAFSIHLGHPEYELFRLANEFKRDQAEGRTDVLKPKNYCLDEPHNTWAEDGQQFFKNWITLVRHRRLKEADLLV